MIIEFLKQHEGLRLNAYRCPAGVWTIGYGHTDGVKCGDYVSVDEAEALLRADVAPVEAAVRGMAADSGVSLRECQLAALVSFAFNLGVDALRRSTLWRKVSANPADPSIANEFARWVYASGHVMPGLVNRRAAEARLYFRQ